METPKDSTPTKEELEDKKKGILGKLTDAVPDREEQIAIVGVAVRLAIVVWSGFCLTLAYIDVPGFPKQTFDPTFIASIFTSTLTTFGVQAANKKGEGSVTKEDMEKLIASNNGGGSYQTIRVQTPLKIEGAELVVEEKPPVDNTFISDKES